ncbi:hypothetical protein ACH4SP_27940 [Streptomyces sp. NPDC021093]|uniref:hypothetical protein n=1 Tax=Streptomyces sp. NPDC021093 TaxID=3365112 RepID=UPI003794920A
MEWFTLASTLVGGMIAAVAALLADGRRWKRERSNQSAEVRRTLYGSYLASLTQARHTCSALARDPEASAAARRSAINVAFDPCNAFRAQVTIVAPWELVTPSRRAFLDLQEFGNRIVAGLNLEDPEYTVRRIRHDQLLTVLIDAMRKDLGNAT